MDPDSIRMSIAMLKSVIGGKTYGEVAAEYGVTRTAVERRIKACALKLSREVGIEGINEGGIAFVQRLRSHHEAISAALEQYTPGLRREKPQDRLLTDDDIAFLVHRTRMRSPCPHRDVALLYVLFSTGARPLEIARLEVRDYLNQNGYIRTESLMRAEVAVGGKARPMYFASARVNEAIDSYLAGRSSQSSKALPAEDAQYRGIAPHSQLFLTDSGTPFEIVRYGELGQTRFLCRGILDTYRKIFRRAGIEGLSALGARRMVAARLFERGADEDQIGEVLGIGEMKAIRQLLPKIRLPMQIVMRDLV